MAERPIDALDRAKGKKIFVKLKNGEEVTGSLRALDLHLNLWVDDAEIQGKEDKKKFNVLLVRGDNVLYASPV
ncbi:MAG: small nuclear ribonucleoprotein [Candidatus Aenigmarchaeota archaeon]|nr:small nuclear ribonucleoprotein [Candidatus Aenigmarchaeota archaeon]